MTCVQTVAGCLRRTSHLRQVSDGLSWEGLSGTRQPGHRLLSSGRSFRHQSHADAYRCKSSRLRMLVGAKRPGGYPECGLLADSRALAGSVKMEPINITRFVMRPGWMGSTPSNDTGLEKESQLWPLGSVQEERKAAMVQPGGSMHGREKGRLTARCFGRPGSRQDFSPARARRGMMRGIWLLGMTTPSSRANVLQSGVGCLA